MGEASNPGPRVRRRRRVLSSVSRSDSNFTHSVGRNGGRSQCGSDNASIF